MWLGENNRKNENTGRKRALSIPNLGVEMDERGRATFVVRPLPGVPIGARSL
jgi:hypothetical protein